MRMIRAASTAICLTVFAATVQAQEVERQQVRAVDYKARATVAIDSMAADLAALDASNARIVATAEGLGSICAQMKEGLKGIASIADRLRRTSQEPSPATAVQNDLIRAIDEMHAQMSQLEGQFLALQNSMQQESRKYQTLSNALKARHDTAMNSIRNMK